MIALNNVSKFFLTPRGRNYVLRDVNLTIGLNEKLGILGKNGAGKSTLLRLFAGVDIPNSGTVERSGSISWPMGLATGLQMPLTGCENAKFACRIQGVDQADMEQKLRFVREFSEIEDYFEMPVRTYSSGMRARLNFAIAMAFDFDFYIIDELTSVGDQAFRTKSREIFKEKREKCGFIKVSHNLGELAKECQSGLLLHDGKLTYFASIKEAIKEYKETISESERAKLDQGTAKLRQKMKPVKKKAPQARNSRKASQIAGQQPKLIVADNEAAARATQSRTAAPHNPAPMMPRTPSRFAKKTG